MIEFENQHWVPKFLLKKFADSDGRVFSYQLATGEIRKRPPKNCAASPNFNELLVEGDPRSFEQGFERLETAAAPVISSILTSESLAQISDSQRLIVSEFLAAQSFRTMAFRHGLELRDAKKELGSVLATFVSDQKPLASLIYRRHWALMLSCPPDRFILGDNPLTLQKAANPSEGGELGLDMLEVEAFFPMSPRVALYLPSRVIGDEIIQGHWSALQLVALAIAGIELKLGDSRANFARDALLKSQGLYRALRFGEPLQATTENVINLNAQQIFWASESVFSDVRDFSFVEEVLRRSPRARKILPVRLHRL